jgi:hypothetical protein
MAFAIKAEVRDPRAKTFAFAAQKTMYGGKRIAKGDTIFVFASENEGGHGLIAKGALTRAEAIVKRRDVTRQTLCQPALRKRGARRGTTDGRKRTRISSSTGRRRTRWLGFGRWRRNSHRSLSLQNVYDPDIANRALVNTHDRIKEDGEVRVRAL